MKTASFFAFNLRLPNTFFSAQRPGCIEGREFRLSRFDRLELRPAFFETFVLFFINVVIKTNNLIMLKSGSRLSLPIWWIHQREVLETSETFKCPSVSLERSSRRLVCVILRISTTSTFRSGAFKDKTIQQISRPPFSERQTTRKKKLLRVGQQVAKCLNSQKSSYEMGSKVSSFNCCLLWVLLPQTLKWVLTQYPFCIKIYAFPLK